MEALTIDPEIMHGALCFTNTRVQVRTLFDYLLADRTIDQFLADFPTVSRDQLIQARPELAASLQQLARSESDIQSIAKSLGLQLGE